MNNKQHLFTFYINEKCQLDRIRINKKLELILPLEKIKIQCRKYSKKFDMLVFIWKHFVFRNSNIKTLHL